MTTPFSGSTAQLCVIQLIKDVLLDVHETCSCASHVQHVKDVNISALLAFGLNVTAGILENRDCIVLTLRASDVPWLLSCNGFAGACNLLLQFRRRFRQFQIKFSHKWSSS